MRNHWIIPCGFLLALSVSAPMAQDMLPTTALMRQQGNNMYRELNAMVKGEKPFDAAKAEQAMTALVATAGKITTTFTEDLKGKSTPNGRYSASTKIWENKADFDAHAAKLVEALRDARSKVRTLDELKAVYPSVAGTCDGCHQTYRLRKG